MYLQCVDILFEIVDRTFRESPWVVFVPLCLETTVSCHDELITGVTGIKSTIMTTAESRKEG